MAEAKDIKYGKVNVSITEEKGAKKIVLMYDVPDPKDRIKWEWIHQPSDDGTITHVAHMVARDSGLGDRTMPIPDEIYQKLGSPKKSRAGRFFKVKMSRKDDVSIEKYFELPHTYEREPEEEEASYELKIQL